MHNWRATLSLISTLLLASQPAQASDETLEKIFKAIGTSFDVPIQDLYKKKHDSEARNIFSGMGLSFSHTLPLRGVVIEGADGFDREGSSATATSTTSMSFSYALLGYWYLSLGFPFYSNPELQAPWNPQYTYVFGYRDWHPYTLGFSYANYGGNRFNPGPGDPPNCFKCGAVTLSWKFPIPEWMTHPFVLWEEGRVGCTVSVTMSLKTKKKTGGLGCRYNIIGWWYFQLNIKHYFDKDTIQPWDADYSYGFGYFDWHPGVISIQYNNFSNNRFPWAEQPEAGGEFRDGSVSIAWGMSF